MDSEKTKTKKTKKKTINARFTICSLCFIIREPIVTLG